MKNYDVIVVGAGPAGGQCARELTMKGFQVLLIDKAKTFLENNYSSGGAPTSLLKDFSLPASIVGSYCHQLVMQSTRERKEWQGNSPYAVVLDFEKLRQFLADEVAELGGDVRLGIQYQSHQLVQEGVEVQLKDLLSGEALNLKTRVLVDATGTDRKVIHSLEKSTQMTPATGIEFHIKVTPEIYEKYADTLTFFLGNHWMPQGYGWIFPMAPHQLKVGVARYDKDKVYVPYTPSYQHYLDQLLALCGEYELEDRHGKTIYYSLGQKNKRMSERVIAIGDAISSINPLGWEGIRHALFCGREAAQTLLPYLKHETKDFKAYDKTMSHYFGWRWSFSEFISHQLFRNKKDSFTDFAVRLFSYMNYEEIVDLIFNYKFRHLLRAPLRYFLERKLRTKDQKKEMQKSDF